MSEESNPIKDHLFDYIKKSNIITKLISEKKFDVIINKIIENCYDKNNFNETKKKRQLEF